MKSFSATGIVSESWSTFKKSWMDVYKFAVVAALITWLPKWLGKMFDDGLLSTLLGLVAAVLGIAVQFGGIKYLLSLVRGGKVLSWDQVVKSLQPYSNLFYFFVGNLIYGIMVFIGLLLLVIPGLYLAIKYMFVPFLIADRKLDIGKAFAESDKMTKGNMGELFVLEVLVVILNAVGALLLGFGLLITIPVSYLAMVKAYTKLSTKK